MIRPKSDIEKLDSLLDALEDSLLEASADEIIDETKQEGKQPEVVARQVKELIDAEINEHRRKKLRDAREGYRNSFAQGTRRSAAIPGTPAERRQLVANILSRRTDVPSAITVSWREGRYASDEDVASLLEDLAELGFLEKKS